MTTFHLIWLFNCSNLTKICTRMGFEPMIFLRQWRSALINNAIYLCIYCKHNNLDSVKSYRLKFQNYNTCKEMTHHCWNISAEDLLFHVHSASFNPFNSKSNKHLISPYRNTAESFIKVMRIKEMITNLRSFYFLTNSPLQYQKKCIEKSKENVHNGVN